MRDLSLEAERGEMISLLGPSGCGKTTTLKIVGGFTDPDGGAILLDGDDLTETAPEKRPTATVFQSYALFPQMSVIQNVIYGLKFRKISHEVALSMGMDMLTKVGLPHSAPKSIHQLSGGEQQRVALARALVLGPKLLLMDEPLSNLDAKLRVKMRMEIRKLQRELGITALYVTHDQEEAMAISDRIAVMNEGSIVQTGSPREIYLHPADPFVADFIGRSNMIPTDSGPIAVHPEDIYLSRDGEGIEAKVLDSQYKGAMTTYYLKAGGLEIEADVLSRSDRGWRKGEMVMVSFASKK